MKFLDGLSDYFYEFGQYYDENLDTSLCNLDKKLMKFEKLEEISWS